MLRTHVPASQIFPVFLRDTPTYLIVIFNMMNRRSNMFHFVNKIAQYIFFRKLPQYNINVGTATKDILIMNVTLAIIF